MPRREFQLVQGTANKFWAVDVQDKSLVLQWGRIGTAGQSQTKEFASESDAAKQLDKLIAEKVGKGYTEVRTGTHAPVSNATARKPVERKEALPAATIDTATTDAEPAPSVAAPAAQTKTIKADRSIDLSPADWAIATWRPRYVADKGEERPFDLEARIDDVARTPTRTYGWDWDWSHANIPPTMTAEEAHFWLVAMCAASRESAPAEVAKKMRTRTYGPMSFDHVRTVLGGKKYVLRPEVLLPLARLVSIEQLLELLDEPPTKRHAWGSEQLIGQTPSTTFGFREFVLPYLSTDELERLRVAVRQRIEKAIWPTDHYERPASSYFIAAMLGFSAELQAVLRNVTPDFYRADGWDHTHYHQPQVIVLGLGDPATIESEMRRLRLPLNQPEYVRGWLATTEYAALDYPRESIGEINNREVAENLMREFARVKAPEAAAQMLELKLSSRAPRIARQWLDENVGHTIAGLMPVAAGRGRLADAAVEHLRGLKSAGYGDAIAAAAGDPAPERVRKDVLDYAEAALDSLDEATTPPWLIDATAAAPKAGKLPAWLPNVPPLRIGERRLSDQQAATLIATLQKTPLGESHPLLAGLRQHADAASRDAFAWRLFEAWQAEGCPSKDKWAMAAIGHLGGDACVLKLTPMVRNWPGESQHQRAVFGLDCLRAVGTDTALMALNGIAQKLKFKGLKAKAAEAMEAVATGRNMSRQQLEDRIVPDCDLDERGTRVFDYGPRQFRLVLGPDMKPMVKDADGKLKSDLPKPTGKDDTARAEAAVATWKLLKKQVKEVAKVQAERLEQAMVTGRRWTPEEFDTLLVKHPLMVNLVRLVVWATYDAAGGVVTTFRVNDDNTLTDENDEPFDLPANAVHVGVVHPAHLPADTLRAWGQVFGDYELIPPFEQLGRRVNTLEPDERGEVEFKRFADVVVPAVTMVGILERLSWTRGIPQDAGIFYEHSKPFPGVNVTCVVQYEPGVGVGYMNESEEQSKIVAFFVPGLLKPHMYPEHTKRLKLGDVDAVVVSEMIRDLGVIASKAK